MEKQEMTIEMAKALATFQDTCPDIDLDGTVKTEKYTFKYATLPNIIKKTRAALSAAGLVVMQPINERVVQTIVFCVKDGTSLGASMALPERGKLQDTGADITYIRRYLLVSILGIVAEDDKDAVFMPPLEAPKAKPKVLTKPMLDRAILRISEGEKGVLELVKQHFALTPEQEEQLRLASQ